MHSAKSDVPDHKDSTAYPENPKFLNALPPQSELVRVDLKTAAVTKRFKGVGTKSHAIVAWRGSLLVLDSEAGGLLRVNPHNGSHTTLWKV